MAQDTIKLLALRDETRTYTEDEIVGVGKALSDVIAKRLLNGDRVQLPGIGVLYLKVSQTTRKHIPGKGLVNIPARYEIEFNMSQAMGNAFAGLPAADIDFSEPAPEPETGHVPEAGTIVDGKVFDGENWMDVPVNNTGIEPVLEVPENDLGVTDGDTLPADPVEGDAAFPEDEQVQDVAVEGDGDLTAEDVNEAFPGAEEAFPASDFKGKLGKKK